mgnify:CR=1 FL=1
MAAVWGDLNSNRGGGKARQIRLRSFLSCRAVLRLLLRLLRLLLLLLRAGSAADEQGHNVQGSGSAARLHRAAATT